MGADAADGGYLWQSMWILLMSSLSSHSTSASVSLLSHFVTHTAVSSPKINSEKRKETPLTVSRSEHYLNETGIAVFKKFTSY